MLTFLLRSGARDVMLDAGIKQAIKTIRIDPSKL
jgi:hypothetical protein